MNPARADAEDHATFVVPTYNRADLIAECLLSIRGQSARNWSITVVDDQSTDGTRSVVEGLGIPNLTYLFNDARLGASKSRNRGALRATDGFLVFLDSDDRLDRQHLERVRAVLAAEPDVGIVCCDSRVIDVGGSVLHGGASFQTLEAERKLYRLKAGRRRFEDIFVFSTTFPGTAIRRSVFGVLGGFDQSIFPMDDVDLQLRAAATGVGVYYLDEVLADYRTHVGSASAGAGRAVETCRKKVACLSSWMSRRPGLDDPRPLRHRLADAHLELAIASWQQRALADAARALVRAGRVDATVLFEFARARYRVRRQRAGP